MGRPTRDLRPHVREMWGRLRFRGSGIKVGLTIDPRPSCPYFHIERTPRVERTQGPSRSDMRSLGGAPLSRAAIDATFPRLGPFHVGQCCMRRPFHHPGGFTVSRVEIHMAEFQVLVPTDRKVESVMGDGVPAALMLTITPPDAEFSVQTYSVPNAMPPRVITIQFEI
jgi:hypothetical protein